MSVKSVELQIDGKNVVTFIGDGPYSFNWPVKEKTGKHLKAYRQLPILRNALQEHLRKAQADSAIATIMKAA